MLLRELIAALLFIASSGIFFNKRFRSNYFAVGAAGLIAITSTYFLYKEISSRVFTKKIGDRTADEVIPCRKQFLRVTKDDPLCNFSLSAEGEIRYKRTTVSGPIAVTTAEALTPGITLTLPPNSPQRPQFGAATNKQVKYAKSLEIYPASNSGRFFFIKGCEDEGASFCWVYFIFDTQESKLSRTNGGHYGPVRWIQWSSDDKYAIINSPNNNVDFIRVLNSMTGASFAFPRDGFRTVGKGDIKVDLSTLQWMGPRTFKLKVADCFKEYCEGTSLADEGRLREFVITPKGLIN